MPTALAGPRPRKPSSSYPTRRRAESIHWLFRSNIPRRRQSLLPADTHKRNFFGMGEVLGVLANPAETLRSLTESKRLLDEARKEIAENRERAQIRPKHTFSRLPGFFPRRAEVRAIERALEGEPAFTVLFGASSVGKTALLREVLCRPSYHVLHFDLRIAGFADLASLYTSLSEQMEQYFEEIAVQMDGYAEFEKEAWSFKHDRINVDKRLSEGGQVRTSDVARLMELFQSSLLKYWQFEPFDDEKDAGAGASERPHRQESDTSDYTHVNHSPAGAGAKRAWGFRFSKAKAREVTPPRTEGDGKEKARQKPPKKMPVIFFDEAHKLPALIQSREAMKVLLDSMLVLTKQDRLCHVIHATSDPFYQTWLRQLNVMQHCKIITIGDCSKAETRAFFVERLLPRVPEALQAGLDFATLFDAFGGKLAHWYDFVTDYVNANGNLDVKQSSHFLQAHALLNLHIIHSSQAGAPAPDDASAHTHTHAGSPAPGPGGQARAESLHPALGPAGFRIYSPLSHHTHDAGAGGGSDVGDGPPEFSAMQLLKVMSRLAGGGGAGYLPYFLLCRELGVRAVDGMVRGRVLELRWTEAVTLEGVDGPGGGGHAGMGAGMETGDTTMVEGSDMAALSDAGHGMGMGMGRAPSEEGVFEEVVGPKLVPTTPIMRYAMMEVVAEYEDERSVSEYASLSDVDEY